MTMTMTPDWPLCSDAKGCTGVPWMAKSGPCLAHLRQPDLPMPSAGDDIDLRGTALTQDLLSRILTAMTPDDGTSSPPKIGTARFDGATFSGTAQFDGATFSGTASFDGATFSGTASFDRATFSGTASFDRATFSGTASFDTATFSGTSQFNGATFSGGTAKFNGATFSGIAWFDRATFSGTSWFGRATFSGAAWFGRAKFSGTTSFDMTKFSGTARFDRATFSGIARFDRATFSGTAWFDTATFSGTSWFNDATFSEIAWFDRATFSETARFDRATFSGTTQFGRATFSETAQFDESRFEGSWLSTSLVCRGGFSARSVVLEQTSRLSIAEGKVDFSRARLKAKVDVIVRQAEVDLTDAGVDALLTITSEPLSEAGQSRPAAAVVSLSGVDAANLVLGGVDLSRCVFSGAYHLDQIRFEGRCTFAATPRGWHAGKALIPLRRWTSRKVLAEEAAWRASPEEHHRALDRAGWTTPVGRHGGKMPDTGPEQLAVLYRQLRKALEDGKDAPGAADFYYGEMEARRHDKIGTPRGERWLLHAYWLVSGYALRATRALGFLAATAAVTFWLIMALGLPGTQPTPQITGTIPAPGGHASLAESTPDPVLTLPWDQRFTAARADQAGQIVINAVVFRSTNATLTGAGIWIELVSRIGEPVLLGFAAIAARGRVQR
jgi:uncharacterized protein YjbI with pentapeptide repeats